MASATASAASGTTKAVYVRSLSGGRRHRRHPQCVGKQPAAASAPTAIAASLGYTSTTTRAARTTTTTTTRAASATNAVTTVSTANYTESLLHAESAQGSETASVARLSSAATLAKQLHATGSSHGHASAGSTAMTTAAHEQHKHQQHQHQHHHQHQHSGLYTKTAHSSSTLYLDLKRKTDEARAWEHQCRERTKELAAAELRARKVLTLRFSPL